MEKPKTFFDKEKSEGFGHNFMEGWSQGWDDMTDGKDRPPEKHEDTEQDVG
jgi:hypothetical protein